eukprot:4678801-Prymnesium_polylepis.1
MCGLASSPADFVLRTSRPTVWNSLTQILWWKHTGALRFYSSGLLRSSSRGLRPYAGEYSPFQEGCSLFVAT